MCGSRLKNDEIVISRHCSSPRSSATSMSLAP
jgi:hypothetical protein